MSCGSDVDLRILASDRGGTGLTGGRPTSRIGACGVRH